MSRLVLQMKLDVNLRSLAGHTKRLCCGVNPNNRQSPEFGSNFTAGPRSPHKSNAELVSVPKIGSIRSTILTLQYVMDGWTNARIKLQQRIPNLPTR